MKIPRQFTMPGGYKVKVRVLAKSVFEKAGGGPQDLAMWRAGKSGGTIYLRKARTGFDRIEDYLHEEFHMTVDWQDWRREQLRQGA